MSYIEQSQQANRHVLPDLVRVFALFGIALVNVGVIAYPLLGGYEYGGLKSSMDKGAYFIVNSLFLMKSYTLFAFMFGVGFAYQLKSADRVAAKFGRRYCRRIVGLLLFGFLNIALLFQGDILVIYAILGSVLFLFKNAQVKTLMRWGIGVFILQTLLFAGMTTAIFLGHKYAPEDMAQEAATMGEAIARSQQAFGEGSFAEVVLFRFREWTEILGFGLFMQGFGTFAFFLFGLAAVKSGIISKPDDEIWQKFRRKYLPIGLLGSAIGAYLMSTGGGVMSSRSMLGMTFVIFFALFSTAGYLGLIASWAAKPMTKLKIFLARGGTASLTAYLLQGLILSLVFNSYGLGLFGKLGATPCISIALVVGALTIGFSSLWRSRFTHGPAEHWLRKFTYL